MIFFTCVFEFRDHGCPPNLRAGSGRRRDRHDRRNGGGIGPRFHHITGYPSKSQPAWVCPDIERLNILPRSIRNHRPNATTPFKSAGLNTRRPVLQVPVGRVRVDIGEQ